MPVINLFSLESFFSNPNLAGDGVIGSVFLHTQTFLYDECNIWKFKKNVELKKGTYKYPDILRLNMNRSWLKN